VSAAPDEKNQPLNAANYWDKRERERERDESAMPTHLPTGPQTTQGSPITLNKPELTRNTTPSSQSRSGSLSQESPDALKPARKARPQPDPMFHGDHTGRHYESTVHHRPRLVNTQRQSLPTRTRKGPAKMAGGGSRSREGRPRVGPPVLWWRAGLSPGPPSFRMLPGGCCCLEGTISGA
jgi:hypothetical protein